MGLYRFFRNYLQQAEREVEQAYVGDVASAGDAEDNSGPWIGVDLDGTLAYHEPGTPLTTIGEPIMPMLNRVRQMLAEGARVKIFTARAGHLEQVEMIRSWLVRQGLPQLEVTNVKDYSMIRLYDDRGIQVETNTGRLVTGDLAASKLESAED